MKFKVKCYVTFDCGHRVDYYVHEAARLKLTPGVLAICPRCGSKGTERCIIEVEEARHA